ncbi:hypothetical protein [Paludisphaera rhizosphaerae]|uniref:hypothetical protein n=1 Tax=Paludisphaera rhizosphaerae TaxID=2711216 RepID=UPI0013EADCCF|nr:hypothetical protein [Paludisphaera rhizosphaerae]
MKRTVAAVVIAVLTLGAAARPAAAQEEPSNSGLSQADEEKLRMLSDPEALSKKDQAKDARQRIPFEVFRSSVPPSEVLPWVKSRHWHAMAVDLRANLDDYVGSLQTSPIALPDMPQDVTFGREARLIREQRTRLGMSFLLPSAAAVKEMPLELGRPGAIRPDHVYPASIKAMAPNQMLVVVLTKEASGGYATWSRMNATLPGSLDRADAPSTDVLRYYRMSLFSEPDNLSLPNHPLTWTAVSHVVWDGMEPDVISVAHQEALIDWIHWGGQLILMGGAGPKFSVLRDSFLDAYLPADSTGEVRSLDEADLKALAEAYRPPPGAVSVADRVLLSSQPGAGVVNSGYRRMQPAGFDDPIPQRSATYGAPDPIRTADGVTVLAAVMRPREGSTLVPIREGGELPLAVERRVGRGRITMLAVNPTEPALVAWKGLDSMVRRVVFRRPEESSVALGTVPGPVDPVQVIQGPDLTWYRIATRDVGVPSPPPPSQPPNLPAMRRGFAAPSPPGQFTSVDYSASGGESAAVQTGGVTEWRDDSQIPIVSRDALEKSSGIKVPSSSFVLKVILAYVLAIAPLNWLICRVILRRRELAWVAVPLLALGFAGAVERVAAYDLGFDSAGDELDVLEIQGEFPRGHISRFGSIYTTGHGRYAIRFPNDTTALALPMATGRAIAGEDRTTAAWRSFPIPALEDFIVQPRSLSMYRAEQMANLSGPIVVEGEAGSRKIRNSSGMELRDAFVIEQGRGGSAVERYLGTIAPDAVVDLDGDDTEPPAAVVNGYDGPDPSAILHALRRPAAVKPEEIGEIRLTAWTPGPAAGPEFSPPLDRHRGSTVVVAHLRYGPPPDPAGRHYDLNADAR